MNKRYPCSRCGDWPEVSYELEGARWCGACAPWARAPCPLEPHLELGARIVAQLKREGRTAACSDAERMLVWLEDAAAAWPGPDPNPWRTVWLATLMQHRLLLLERGVVAAARPAALAAAHVR